MNVFIPQNYEYTGGVFASLEEAYKSENDAFVNNFYKEPGDNISDVAYDEYVVGQKERVRSYDRHMKLWWENGKCI